MARRRRKGKRVPLLSGGNPQIAKSGGALFFVWTLLALGVTAVFSVILSARALLGWRRHQ